MPQNPWPTELETGIKKMIDAGETEDNIASAIQEYKRTHVAPVDGNKSPLTEGLKAGWEGAKGWAKGATLDLPASIGGGLQSIANAAMHPIDTIQRNNPFTGSSDISDAASSMWNTTKQAGQNPGAFGEMMGQVGGQPLVTAGITEAAPPITRMMGSPVAKTGSIMERYQPLSGMVPRFADMRTLRNIERFAGGKIGDLGDWMKNVGKNSSNPNIIEGEVLGEDKPSQLNTQNTKTPPIPYRKLLSAPTEFDSQSPTAHKQAFDQIYARHQELVDKARVGTLTPTELQEGQYINKILRSIDFNRDSFSSDTVSNIKPKISETDSMTSKLGGRTDLENVMEPKQANEPITEDETNKLINEVKPKVDNSDAIKTIQSRINVIESNIKNKYKGDISKASDSTKKTLMDLYTLLSKAKKQ